jgi:hypothetical protein
MREQKNANKILIGKPEKDWTILGTQALMGG